MRIHRREALALLGAGLAMPSIVRAQDAGPITIGNMIPLSGPASIEGHQLIKGVQMAVEEANAKGGALGRKIALVTEDDESNSTKGVTIARKLIEKDKVPFIVATYATAVALAVTRVARDYKIPVLSCGSTGAIATQDNPPGDPWFFRCWPDSDMQGEQTARAIVDYFKKTKVAIIRDNTNYGATLADQVTKVVKSAGGTIVDVETYNAGEQDFSSMLTKLRTLRPEAVFIGGWAGDGANIVRQAAEVGLRSQFVGSGSMVSDDFIKLAGPASEGFAVATNFEPSTPNETGRAFAERFKKRYGEDPNLFNALAFDSTNIAVEAMRRAGKPDGAAIQQILKSGMADFPIVQGPAGTTARFNDKGSVDFQGFVSVVKNGHRQIAV
jgi:branched-chain amino acid transport system substrate-binding protein